LADLYCLVRVELSLHHVDVHEEENVVFEVLQSIISCE